MTTLHMIGMLAVTAGLAILVNRFLRYYELHLIDDAARMRVAAERLAQFQEVVDEIVESPKADLEMKEFAATFAHCVLQRDFAQFAAAEICAAARGQTRDRNLDEEGAAEADAFDARQRSRADTVDIYRKAIRTGMSAAVLQWPDTSRQMAYLLSEIAIEPEERWVAKAVATKSRRDHIDHNGPMPLAAA